MYCLMQLSHTIPSSHHQTIPDSLTHEPPQFLILPRFSFIHHIIHPNLRPVTPTNAPRLSVVHQWETWNPCPRTNSVQGPRRPPSSVHQQVGSPGIRLLHALDTLGMKFPSVTFQFQHVKICSSRSRKFQIGDGTRATLASVQIDLPVYYFSHHLPSLLVEDIDRSHARTKKPEVAMGETKTMDVVKSEDHPVPRSPQTPSTPQTYELRKNGYLALTRGLGSGVYDTGLSSQVSGGIEIFGLQNRDIVGSYNSDSFGNSRQSSIDTEPHTLATITVRHAKDGAVEIIKTYDEDEALHLFLKDAEDEHLREEAMAAILPVAPELVT